MATQHIPVLLDAVLKALAPRPGGRYIDTTLGGGGHSEAILRASAPDGRLLALDADPQALERARARLAPFGDRVVLRQGNFRHLYALATVTGFRPADGILFDLGWSSDQLTASGRGFSFRADEPLDLRYDPTAGEPAWVRLAQAEEEEIAQVLRRYGEEPRARAIARAIKERQAQEGPIRTARELGELVARIVRPRGRIHPATRTFQALRIWVNEELEALEEGLRQALELLAPGGRLVVLTFHSLEDRLVKRFLRRHSDPCVYDPTLPPEGCPHFLRQGGEKACIHFTRAGCAYRPPLRLLYRKPLRPDPEEVNRNPRARSAHLRAAVREEVAP